MKFTNEDLKRLKEKPWCAHESHALRDCGVLAEILAKDVPALLARLDAAEALISDYPQYEPEQEEKRKVWRKSRGGE